MKMNRKILSFVTLCCLAVSLFAQEQPAEEYFMSAEEPAIGEDVFTSEETIVTDEPAAYTVDEPVAADEPYTVDESIMIDEPIVIDEPAVPVPAPVIIAEPVAPPPAPVIIEPAVAAATPVSTGKPTIAVYVTGGDDPLKSRALATYILDAIAGTRRYTPIERSEAFLAEIDNEQIRQRSGAIDDSQISALGKQSGVRYVCVADIIPALRGFQISARILDVETAEVKTVGVSTSTLRTIDDLKNAAADVVAEMFKKLYPEDYLDKPERKVRFGVRAAYNNSYVTKLSFTLVDYDPVLGHLVYNDDNPGKVGAGSGFEISFVTSVSVTDDIAFSLQPGFIMRTPHVSDAARITEFAVSVPALIEWRLFQTPVRALAGLQMDIPFGTKIKWADESESEPVESGIRSSVDFGVVFGASVQVHPHISIDARFCAGLREFDREKGKLMHQVSVGASYVY